MTLASCLRDMDIDVFSPVADVRLFFALTPLLLRYEMPTKTY